MGLTKLRQNGADWKRLKSDRQRRFVLEYMIDHDQRQAAIRAGYKESGAAVMGCKLMKDSIVRAIIGRMERQDVEELELSREETLRQLYYALTRRVRDFVDGEGVGLLPHELPEQSQSILDGFEQEVEEEIEDGKLVGRKIKTKYRLTPHAAAREQAMKHKGLFAPTKEEVKHLHLHLKSLLEEPDEPDLLEGKIAEEESEDV